MPDGWFREAVAPYVFDNYVALVYIMLRSHVFIVHCGVCVRRQRVSVCAPTKGESVCADKE